MCDPTETLNLAYKFKHGLATEGDQARFEELQRQNWESKEWLTPAERMEAVKCVVDGMTKPHLGQRVLMCKAFLGARPEAVTVDWTACGWVQVSCNGGSRLVGCNPRQEFTELIRWLSELKG